jgi:hypothetical protein
LRDRRSLDWESSVMKTAVIATLGALVVVVCACSPKPDPGTGDASSDAGPPDGSCKCPGCGKCAPDAGDAMLMCPTPLDVSGFTPDTLPAPNGKHQNECMQAQLDLYHKCVGQPQDMAACMQIQAVAKTTFEACLSCLETRLMDATWGPLVCLDSTTCHLNVEGCVNLATGMTGMTSCGQLLHASYGCQRAACEMQCSGDSQGFSKCVQTALAGGCKKYGDAFTAMCGNISADPDGGYPDLDNCFRRQTETDSQALRVRMDTFFCGP